MSRLARRNGRALAVISVFTAEGLWPPVVPTPVLVECLTGDSARDALTHRFLKTCDVVETIPERTARRAAWLRTRARRGSAVDAILVALAEPGGTVLTGDTGDLAALAAHAEDVGVERI